MSDIAITDLTTGAVDGAGVFDRLMQAVNAHINREYTNQRIKGTDYANVYLRSLEVSMTQALQFVLTEERAGHEADLAKTNTELAELQKQKLTKEIALLDQQIKVQIQQEELLKKQVLKTVQETAVLVAKEKTERAQTESSIAAADSVIGKQKTLYERQADGFLRDAEQKAVDSMMQAWVTARTTDPNTVPTTAVLGVDNAKLATMITKLGQGVGVNI